MVTKEIEEYRQIVKSGKFVRGPGRPGRLIKGRWKKAYYRDLLKRVTISKKFKIVVDTSNSTPGAIVPELLEEAGSKVIRHNCKLDGEFPLGPPDPTEEKYLKRLSYP